MKFNTFQEILSIKRIQRYYDACSQNKRKTLHLYHLNLHLSQEMFAVISCFEIALRNAIDRELSKTLGSDWLRDAILPGGVLDSRKTIESQRIIKGIYNKFLHNGTYNHSNLLTHMDFGIWKYMYSSPQFNATGQVLLNVFPSRPRSTKAIKYNNTYLFNELDKVNSLRNRIAHHEQICFTHHSVGIDTGYIRNEYQKIITLFQWMDIDSKGYLRGLDHVLRMCDKIDKI